MHITEPLNDFPRLPTCKLAFDTAPKRLPIGDLVKPFVIRANLRTPVIFNGYMTLDALLMAELQRGDVSDLIHCVDDLYFASAAVLESEAGKITGVRQLTQIFRAIGTDSPVFTGG